jgi:hypothetical protein
MEKDTVILDLKTYNELREFKETIENGDVIMIREHVSTSFSSYSNYNWAGDKHDIINTDRAKIFTLDDALDEVCKINEEVTKRNIMLNDLLEKEINEFNSYKVSSKVIIEDEIVKLNLFEFIKLKYFK